MDELNDMYSYGKESVLPSRGTQREGEEKGGLLPSREKGLVIVDELQGLTNDESSR